MKHNAKNKERMENRKRIIELLTAVRYTTNDIEKVADEICSLFNVVGQSEVNRRELLLDFADYSERDKTSQTTDECVDNYLDSTFKTKER